MPLLLPLVLLSALAPAAPVVAVADTSSSKVCSAASTSRPMDRAEIERHAASLGYPFVIEVEMEGGCIHIEARTRDGRTAEVVLHPVTAAVISAEIED